MTGGFSEAGRGCFLCGGDPYRGDHGPVGAGLPAMQATRVLWVNRVDIIAGKPAPTEGWPEVKYPRQISRLPDLCTVYPGE